MAFRNKQPKQKLTKEQRRAREVTGRVERDAFYTYDLFQPWEFEREDHPGTRFVRFALDSSGKIMNPMALNRPKEDETVIEIARSSVTRHAVSLKLDSQIKGAEDRFQVVFADGNQSLVTGIPEERGDPLEPRSQEESVDDLERAARALNLAIEIRKTQERQNRPAA